MRKEILDKLTLSLAVEPTAITQFIFNLLKVNSSLEARRQVRDLRFCLLLCLINRTLLQLDMKSRGEIRKSETLAMVF
jgi:hypothetical protein